MQVIIGVDPHKASHTAVAIDDDEHELGSVKVRATRRQVAQLLSWAEPFEKRMWAIESACGLGYLLSQQLVAAGEAVVDVPATLASRVRVLGTGRSDKNDPNDARSVAIAALRTSSLRSVEVADHAEVLRLLAKRNLDIGSHRTRVVCRLHAALTELAPGGIAKELNASDALELLARIEPASPVEQTRNDLAAREDKRERLCNQRDRLNIPQGRLFGEVTSRTQQHATTTNPITPRGQPRAPKAPRGTRLTQRGFDQGRRVNAPAAFGYDGEPGFE
jgi:hypothetical protein